MNTVLQLGAWIAEIGAILMMIIIIHYYATKNTRFKKRAPPSSWYQTGVLIAGAVLAFFGCVMLAVGIITIIS